MSAALLLGPAMIAAADVARPQSEPAQPQTGLAFATQVQILTEKPPGDATTKRRSASSGAFDDSAANLAFDDSMTFVLGRAIFRKLWVSSPSSTTASDGLGPLYNARSCQRCHLNNGRGRPPEGPHDSTVSLFLRLSIPAHKDADPEVLRRRGVIPEPVYGTQLQTFAVPGMAAEGQLQVSYEEKPVALSGGEEAWLRTPSYRILTPAYGPLHPELQISPRIAPAMAGLGLLEQISDADILGLADPDDGNGDGISGRPNRVWDQARQTTRLGRFGWKAGNPSLAQQNSSALQGDIGIGNPRFPLASGDCSPGQISCLNAPNGNTPEQDGLEASQQMLDWLLFYSQHIAVTPRPAAADPEVQAGQKLFNDAGCAACHQPHFVTAENPQLPALSRQSIWPYTDLLLHDMGAGLADERAEFAANGREWRTAPLWGIGQTAAASGHPYFLHDGRARSLLEAVLWHGGEARAAREQVATMPASQRTQLIRFLESL
ncbi:di-heme oxidoreductase family protein [Marinobacterium sedimentorum]|uniref:di-heme oxidoreductase family protein n=1 Tax=Marinobacterium sedimentorum TaxID=2927804 RepID=UPI0020C6491F|nr:di-heme oxidoredictase family protein [Marinobacterium sedimentorum]MCP8688279.1 c-type cytochrome [Marinobacterium sedimentorum]